MSARRDLAEWVVYLKEIGVRELHLPSSPVESPGVARTIGPRESRRAHERPAPAPAPAPARAAAPTAPPATSPAMFGLGEAPAGDPAARLKEIRAEIGDCTRCRLHEERTKIVFGVGSPRARLMFVGEGPGADEDAQGEPFVGRAGKKLDEMIAAIGLAREDVYIANIVKCRPPLNRDPKPDEVTTCSPFLFEQIAAIRPGVIVTLGSPASKTLLNTKVGITKLRGTWQDCGGIPVMPTYHPAYLLRAYTPENRRRVWDDLKAAKARLDSESPSG